MKPHTPLQKQTPYQLIARLILCLLTPVLILGQNATRQNIQWSETVELPIIPEHAEIIGWHQQTLHTLVVDRAGTAYLLKWTRNLHLQYKQEIGRIRTGLWIGGYPTDSGIVLLALERQWTDTQGTYLRIYLPGKSRPSSLYLHQEPASFLLLRDLSIFPVTGAWLIMRNTHAYAILARYDQFIPIVGKLPTTLTQKLWKAPYREIHFLADTSTLWIVFPQKDDRCHLWVGRFLPSRTGKSPVPLQPLWDTTFTACRTATPLYLYDHGICLATLRKGTPTELHLLCPSLSSQSPRTSATWVLRDLTWRFHLRFLTIAQQVNGDLLVVLEGSREETTFVAPPTDLFYPGYGYRSLHQRVYTHFFLFRLTQDSLNPVWRKTYTRYFQEETTTDQPLSTVATAHTPQGIVLIYNDLKGAGLHATALSLSWTGTTMEQWLTQTPLWTATGKQVDPYSLFVFWNERKRLRLLRLLFITP